MKFIDYDKLHAAFKPSGYVSKDANTIANILIHDLCIQPGSNLARFLEVKTCFDNHMAMRVWIQKRLDVNTMNVKLQPSMTQNTRDLKICGDYWAYNNQGDYIAHVTSVCQKYNISSHSLFQTVGECFAYLDDVRCEYCGYVCPLETPADIPFMRSKKSWCCEVCEHALWREN